MTIDITCQNTSTLTYQITSTLPSVKYYYFGSQRVAMRQGNEVYYLHGDHLGSTSLTTNVTGTVVVETRHHPFGEVRWESGSSVTDFGFTGQRNEVGFGLMDYKARFYSAGLGRFVSADTIVPNPAQPQHFNRYAYTYNNPLSYVDPSGHSGGPAQTLSDFVMGITYEFSANNYDALFIPTTSYMRQPAEAVAVDMKDSVAFQTGRLVGAVGNIAQGYVEITIGEGMIIGGSAEAVVASPTIVGSIPGVGTAVAGVGVAAHGSVVGTHGATGVGDSIGNIYNAISSGPGSSGKGTGISTTISYQKQARHIKGTKTWYEKGERSYFNSQEDAQKVLDAYHSGEAEILGQNPSGDTVVQYNNVTGYNNNYRTNHINQPTSVFVIKGSKSVSIFPTNPNWQSR